MNTKPSYRFSALQILLLAAVGCEGAGGSPLTEAKPPADSVTVTVDATVRHQEISGWEVHPQSGHESAAFARYGEHLFDLAVNDLGINRIRLEAWSGMENTRDYYTEHQRGQISDATWRCVRFATVNDDADPHHINWSGFQFSQLDAYVERVVLPIRRRLAARGEQLFLNLMYDAFVEQCENTPYHHTNPAEYAEFVLATSLHLREKYGLVPDAWEAILEPEHNSFWRGRQIGEGIVAAAHALEAQGFTPRFIAPSNTRVANAIRYFDEMIEVPGVRSYLSELSYHRYGGATPEEIVAIGERSRRYGIKTSMLEHIGSGYEDLHEDLKVGQVSAWQQFALAYPTTDNGAQYYLVDDGTVKLSDRARYLRQYFRYIRRGAVRVESVTTAAALDPLAFVNRDGGMVVVVKADAGSAFRIGGLPAGTYGIRYTTEDETDIAQADVRLEAGKPLQARIPASGVITVFRR